MTTALTGVTTTASLANAIALRSISVEEPHKLSTVSFKNKQGAERLVPYEIVPFLSQNAKTISGATGYVGGVFFTTSTTTGVYFSAVEFVDAGYFSLLGVDVKMGRQFAPTDHPETTAASPVAIISQPFWHKAFHSGADAIGRTFRVDQAMVTVIGIAPPGFTGLRRETTPDVWLPVGMLPALGVGTRPRVNQVIIRGQRSATTQQVQSEALNVSQRGLVDVVAALASEQLRKELPSIQPALRSLSGGFSILSTKFSTPLSVLTVLAILLCFTALANVVWLYLSHFLRRLPDFQVQTALGAKRSRLLLSAALECLLPISAGALLSLPVVYWTAGYFGRMLWVGLAPLTMELGPDWRVLGLTGAVVCAAAVFCGTTPVLAFRHSLQLVSATRVTATGQGWLRTLLLGTQIGLSVALLAAAAQLSATAISMANRSLGFATDNLLLIGLAPLSDGYSRFDEAVYYPELVRSLSQVQGVEAVALSDAFPSISDEARLMKPIGRSGGDTAAAGTAVTEVVSPGFFSALRIPLIAGREFTWSDAKEKPPIAILNASAARLVFPRESAVGQQVRLVTSDGSITAEVVGVVEDFSLGNVHVTHAPAAFRPTLQEPLLARNPFVHIRTSDRMAFSAKAVFDVINQLGHEFPRQTKSLTAHVAGLRAPESVSAVIAGWAALTAYGIASLGIVSALAAQMASRRREFGLRMALGASRRQVALHALRVAIAAIVIGSITGIVLSVATQGLLKRHFPLWPDLPGISPSVVILNGVFAWVALAAGFVGKSLRFSPQELLRDPP